MMVITLTREIDDYFHLELREGLSGALGEKSSGGFVCGDCPCWSEELLWLRVAMGSHLGQVSGAAPSHTE